MAKAVVALTTSPTRHCRDTVSAGQGGTGKEPCVGFAGRKTGLLPQCSAGSVEVRVEVVQACVWGMASCLNPRQLRCGW